MYDYDADIKLRTGARGVPCPLPTFRGRAKVSTHYAHEVEGLAREPGAMLVLSGHVRGVEEEVEVRLVRGRNGKPYYLCPVCARRCTYLLRFSERWEKRGWRAIVPPSFPACRLCHQTRYSSQYEHRARCLARVARWLGFNRTEQEERLAIRAKRDRALDVAYAKAGKARRRTGVTAWLRKVLQSRQGVAYRQEMWEAARG